VSATKWLFGCGLWGLSGGSVPTDPRCRRQWASYDGVDRPVYDTESASYPAQNYTYYTHLYPANTGGWNAPGGWLSFGYLAEEAAARWAKLVITQHAMGVDLIMHHYNCSRSPWGHPSLLTRGVPEIDGAFSPYASAWAVAGRMVSQAKGLGRIEGAPDLRILMFDKKGTALAALWTREHDGGWFSNALKSGLFRKPAEAVKHRGIVRKIMLPEEHELSIALDPESFSTYDIMGNEVPVKANGAGSVLPVSSDPLYLVAKRGVTFDVLRNALAKAEVAGLGSFDLAAGCGLPRASD